MRGPGFFLIFGHLPNTIKIAEAGYKFKLKKLPKIFTFSPKWLNFAESGLTVNVFLV